MKGGSKVEGGATTLTSSSSSVAATNDDNNNNKNLSAAAIQNIRDPYEVLNVSREASDQDIKSAYRRLALNFVYVPPPFPEPKIISPVHRSQFRLVHARRPLFVRR